MLWTRVHNGIARNIGRCKQHVKSRLLNLALLLFKHLPLSKTIVFECESDMADVPFAFYSYLIRNGIHKRYKIVWLVKNVALCQELYQEENVVFLSRFDKKLTRVLELNYYLNTAKLFVFSHPYWFQNWRRGQIVIYTTHSVAQLKASGTGLRDKHVCDYVLSCGPYSTEINKQAMEKGVQHLELGLPRLDLIIPDNSDAIAEKLSPLHKGKKLILSMETFKQSRGWTDSDSDDKYSINVIHDLNDLKKLDHFLESLNCWMIIKIHHLQDISFLECTNVENILYLTDDDLLRNKIQINTLLSGASLLLTDYSSVFYDYLLLDRPIGFMIGDISQYDRGFIMDNPLDYMPGQIIRSFDELCQFLQIALKGEDNHHAEREAARKLVFLYKNGNSERLYKWLTEQGILSL